MALRLVLLSPPMILWILLISQVGTGLSKNGAAIGERCERGERCAGENVLCNRNTRICQCQGDYPIQVHTQAGTICASAAKLGDDCLSEDVCLSSDENSDCLQDGLKSVCQCKQDFHKMYDKAQSKNRCVREAPMLNSDLLTLLIVGAAMTLFCGLTCLVLRIFARARFGPRRGHYANALSPPAVTLSADQGDPRPYLQSRNSSQRSSLAESRRQSGQSSLLAPPTQDSRRASNSSIRSTGSNRSQRSYSLKNPVGHPNQLHPSLQHRPSDPEAKCHLNSHHNTKDNGSGGSGSSVKFNLPNSEDTGPSSGQHKTRRRDSAGTLPV